MATILEMAREIRHHIVSHSTGRLELTYSHCLRSVDFSGGTIVSDREEVFPCFEEAPLEISFLPIQISPPDEFQSGAALLIEAMESVGDRTLERVWEPYKSWRVLLPEDPDVHETDVSSHLEKGPGRLRRMLRLAVSGALTLEPPVSKSVEEEIREIRTATGRGDYWQVLNIARSASLEDVKKAYRKKVRQFHPDRWYSTKDRVLKERVEGAFRDVHYSYEQAAASVPRRLSAVTTAPPHEEFSPIVTESAWAKTFNPDLGANSQPDPKTDRSSDSPGPGPVPPQSAEAAYKQASKVASYSEFEKKASHIEGSLFKRIFEKVFKAA